MPGSGMDCFSFILEAPDEMAVGVRPTSPQIGQEVRLQLCEARSS